MTQTTIIDEGSFTYQSRTPINNQLFADKGVETGAATLVNSGLSTVNSSVATSFTLPSPAFPGTSKYLECIGATANVTVNTSAATIGAAGSSLTKVVFTAAEQAVYLLAETTAKWVRIAQNSSLITVTT